jgi:RNA polymerase sigma-70 factor, ECF subfamily
MAVEEAPTDWNAVYAEQLPRVYNYFRFRLGRHSDIDDLTSRTFERAWKARGQYRRADPRGFDLDIDELAKAAYALTSAARTHDNEAIVQAASQVGAACAACHDAYRKPLGQP